MGAKFPGDFQSSSQYGYSFLQLQSAIDYDETNPFCCTGVRRGSQCKEISLRASQLMVGEG